MSRPPLGSSISVFGLSISWYSLLIMAAIVVGIVLASREEKRLGLPKDTVINFALLAIPLGIIGARLYYVLFSLNRYAQNPVEILQIWKGGLAIYGGVLGGVLAAFLLSRRSNVSFSALLDACAPALVLGQAIGRWGNYANMEAYGARIYDPAAQFFPLAVEIRLVSSAGQEFWYWHMATFFYEFIWDLAVFGILMRYRKRMKYSGDVMLWYLLLYGAGRTVIEGLRDDSLLLNVAAAQIRVSQILSALLCVGVAVFFFVRLTRDKKARFADYLCWALIGLGIACAFVGEFERNAYQMLFTLAQVLLLSLLAVDVVFFIHYFKRAKAFNAPAVWMLAAALLCAGTLALGIGRQGGGNTAYIALRQAVAMAHVVLPCAWFYLRAGAPKLRKSQRTAQRMEAA